MISGIRISSADMVLSKDVSKLPGIPTLKNNTIITAKVIKRMPGGKAVLDINGQPITVKTGIGLKPGETLQLKVSRTREEIVLKLVSPSLKTSSRPVSSLVHFVTSKESNPDMPALKRNAGITAKVVNLMPDGKAVLDVNGQPVTVKTGIALNPGETIQLKVSQAGEEIVFRLMSSDPETSSRPLSTPVHFISRKAPAPGISKAGLQKLGHMLNELAVKSPKADHEFLPRLIEKSGLFFESKMSDAVQQTLTPKKMKTVLNQLLQQDLKGAVFSDMMAAGKDSDILKTLTAFVDTLENFQQINHQSSEGNRYLLPIPFLNGSAFRFGQLLIDTGQNTHSPEKDRDKVMNISFFLDMSNLGPLRADFSILKKAITGRFLLADHDTCAYVVSAIPQLEKRLETAGFEIQKIDGATAAPEQLEQNRLVESLAKTEENTVLNIVV